MKVFFKVIFRRRDEIYENCRNIISKYQQQYVLSNNTIKRFRNLCLPHVKCAVSQKLTLTLNKLSAGYLTLYWIKGEKKYGKCCLELISYYPDIQ